MTEREPGAPVIKRATAADVGRAAGVSAATVSLVLNGKAEGRVTPATSRRVHAAAERLGYRIDRRGQSLATGRSGLIGFVAPDTANPFFGSVQMGVLHALGSSYQVLLMATDVGQSVARKNVEELLSLGVDGMILFAVDPKFVADLHPGVPVVLLDSPIETDEFVRVNFDLVAGATALADHLLEFGHREIVYLEASTASRTFAVRKEAFRRALRRGGASITSVTTPIDVDEARETTLKRWENWRSDGVTAIACATDFQAYGVLSALHEIGAAVPDEVSVTGFDDLVLSPVIHPSLTSVRLPAEEMGAKGAALLRAAVEGHADLAHVETIATSLVVRNSTAVAATR
ncbi:MAG TPA: LacI family DNA-binding transcriptional regulator [Acidothermaceae bacterium]|nr:LacI family DNA-binding transcriptional regulator [Acidothermaceae bacterium]